MIPSPWFPRIAIVATTLALAAPSGAGDPIDLIPAESLLCWYGRAFPDTSAPADEAPSSGSTMLDLATNIAGRAIGSRDQLTVRIIEAFGLMIRYPHAVALIDAQARPVGTGDKGRRGEKQQFVMVVKTGGKSEPFLRIIQKAVNEQVSRGTAGLKPKRASGFRYHELQDSRMPEWFSVAWGDIGDNFVLTVGDGVWPKIAAIAAGEARSMSRDPWYGPARAARGRDALIEIFVNAKMIRERLDPFVDGRATAFFRAWNAADMDRAHWALGFEQRALFCLAHFETAGRTERRLFADPLINEEFLMRTIPDSARYAIYRVSIGQLIPRIIGSIYAMRSSTVQQSADRAWAAAKTEFGFNPERDILPHLGQFVVLHNDPPHPLRLPLAMTMLLEIRSEPAKVREAFEAMCRASQNGLQRDAESGHAPSAMSLAHDPDGVWYLKFGWIQGPAWIVTDRFIISSWSPVALRSYLDKIGSAAGKRAE